MTEQEATAMKSQMEELVDELLAKREHNLKGGGDAKDRQAARARQADARERLDLLIDEGTWVELGLHGRPHFSQRALEGVDAPADGVITGYGKVNGRLVCVGAYDFTVMAGSMGYTGEVKLSRLRALALNKRMPMIWLLDSAGARIQEAVGSLFAGIGPSLPRTGDDERRDPADRRGHGTVRRRHRLRPGARPTSCRWSRARARWRWPDRPSSRPRPARTSPTRRSVATRSTTARAAWPTWSADDDAECIQSIKDYLSYMPMHSGEKPPIKATEDPVNRHAEELLNILPESSRQPYDMYEIIKHIVDDGEYFDMKGKWAKSIITCFARMDGRSVGIVANQPKHLGGILDNDSADKAARFINLCDAYGIPLIYLQDVPGFMVGSKVEEAGIIRHGAKFLYATSRATVPKVTILIRKCYGAGYYVMNGSGYEPDAIYAWPTAEISVMGAEGAVNIIGRSIIEAAEDPEAKRAELLAQAQKMIDVYLAAGNGMIDDVIDPRETRHHIIRALEMAENKHVDRPAKKHGVMPV